MEDLITILQDTLDNNQDKLDNAAEKIALLKQQDQAWLLEALLRVLISCDQEQNIRQQAGLQLKRFLQEILISRTNNNDNLQNIVDRIHQVLLDNLGSESWRPSTIGSGGLKV